MIKKTRKILFVIGVLMFVCLFVGMKSPMSAFADDSKTDTALSQVEKYPPAVEGYQDPSNDDEGEYAPSEEEGQEYIESEEDMSSEGDEPVMEPEEAPPEE